ncbi:MAG: hypothetical protein JXA54_04190 [Candidatus Heimdallarchaeota archaeon]|nr:hypothetical protein [Candidatus Heimdallarchaeota archaeon]
MVRRHAKKMSNLWTTYPNYTPINNINELPLYDETRITQEHRVLSEIIRKNWFLIHPLSRDYILSSAKEWRQLLDEIALLQSTLEIKQNNLDNYQEDYEVKTQRLLLEKDAEIERQKEEITENYRQIIEEKDQEIAQYKILADSVRTGYNETSKIDSSIQTLLDEKDQKVLELGRFVNELRDKCKSQEIEAMNVQTGISKNFQIQISDITNELYERQEQVDKLRDVLAKAKEQLISMKNNNEELKKRNKELEKSLAEKEEKLQKFIKSIERL